LSALAKGIALNIKNPLELVFIESFPKGGGSTLVQKPSNNKGTCLASRERRIAVACSSLSSSSKSSAWLQSSTSKSAASQSRLSLAIAS
jgi:hypothetical protein